ncbi:MAG: hypothetical protein JWN40_4543 [Phycisphaerales bacterium]|nr:hypothetical protein [Phycisphaerales bacterium]
MPPRPTACLLALLVTLASCDLRKDSAAAPAPSRTAATDPTPAASARPPTSLPATDDPFYILSQTYAPYTAASDPFGFPMKARNLSTNAYRFWRGSKELFYVWCKTHAADWLADQPAYLRIHGDLHPGNMGVYPAATGALGEHIAFGAVDFDDSARLPFQIELLEGSITFQLLAKHRQVKLDAARLDQVLAAMLDTYRAALLADQTPTQLLDNDPWVAHLFKQTRKRKYADELGKYLRNDQFIAGNRGRELLQTVPDRASLPEALTESLTHTPDARQFFNGETSIKPTAIREVARRIPLESAGSEGLHKYLVLLTAPGAPDAKLILYLKQQIPSPAERVGLIPTDPRPPGQRCAQDNQTLRAPVPLFNTWCSFRGDSYRVSLKEPWSETLDAANIDNFDDLLHAAKIWGTLAGCLHRQGKPIVDQILTRLTPALRQQLRERGTTYAAKVAEDHHRFDRDPRTKALIKQAEAALKSIE